MPLLLIVGWPSSGKTTASRKIVQHLQEQGKTCELVSDEYLLQKDGRNKLFTGEMSCDSARDSFKADRFADRKRDAGDAESRSSQVSVVSECLISS